jgi:hypothetical protein
LFASAMMRAVRSQQDCVQYPVHRGMQAGGQYLSLVRGGCVHCESQAKALISFAG